MARHSYEDLEVWKRSLKLAVRIYGSLRECRDFGLRDQMQRAAVSIASNIAEGAERGGKDFQRFIRVARGSGAELRTQLLIAAEVGTVSAEEASALCAELNEIGRMLTGLEHKLESTA